MRLFSTIAAVLFVGHLVVAERTSSDTCGSYTLKCSTFKAAWAGKATEVKAVLHNKSGGTTEDVEIRLSWTPSDFSYAKSKFTLKGYTAQTNEDGELYYEGVKMKKSAQIHAVLDVDKCAATTAIVVASADTGNCNLEVECPAVSLTISVEGFYLEGFFSLSSSSFR